MKKTFKEYEDFTETTAKYDRTDSLRETTYLILGLTSEAGEVADKLKKFIRDQKGKDIEQMSEEQKKEIAKELGDVLWYTTRLSIVFGSSLEEVANKNIEKLQSRKDRGKLGGSGDNR